MLSMETIVNDVGKHSVCGPVFSLCATLNWIDQARVSAEEHMPRRFIICIKSVDPPKPSTTSVIRLCRGR